MSIAAEVTETEFTDAERPHAVYRLYDAEGTLLYIGIAWNLPQRMWGHAAEKPWWPDTARKTMAWYASEMEARTAEAIAIDIEKPLHNQVTPAVGSSVPPHGQRSGWNKTPLVGWHPSAELVAWLKAEEKRRGSGKGVRSAILNEALDALRERSENKGES